METDVALTNYIGSKKKINDLLALPKITLKDIEGFTRIERECLSETATEMLNSLKGQQRDDFLEKIDQITPINNNGDIWEYNHARINLAITRLMNQHGFMPLKSAIAEETGLSRQTVAKHLKEYKTSPDQQAEMEQFKFMAPKVLAAIFKSASNGDTRAARLYFEMVGAMDRKGSGTVVNEQNNYIQVNNTILSQETLKKLTTEQLNMIEWMVNGNGGK